MPLGPKKPIPPAVLLAADEKEIIDFLTDSHVQSRRFDVSSIVGLDTLPDHERDAIATKLNKALQKMNPLDTGRLDQLLSTLDLQLASAGASSISFNHANNERCQTSSPPPTEDAAHRQSRDRARLVQAGGRPIMPMEQLGSLSTMNEKNLARAALWLDLPKKHNAAYGEVLPLFSKQLEHWSTFQQYWQWGNRGAAGRDKGFAAFLASMRQDYLDKQETEAVADEASFESMARRKWQDAATMRNSEPRYRRAMEELLLGGEDGHYLKTDQDTPLQQQLEAAKDNLRKQCAKLRRMCQDAKDYLTHEALAFAATEKSDSINGGLGNSRQLRKRKRNDGNEEKGTGTNVNAQVEEEEAAPLPPKRSRTRVNRSLASSAPNTSATEAPPEWKLRGSQRSQDAGGVAVTPGAQPTDADGAATDTGVGPTRGRKPRTVR
ncbi:hypothetical protein FH972_024068 [Carpinus fangiana]|uniref:Uncharacterized protein n=1 Tax=Carpinus fangiana TaxID=176857 RepID=A0A5N6KXB4_9ROSI|nr:hypothetical protein FH972_024068 [Carpinus fangiana]